jgi:predicted metal-dependent phosphoesterase TrpH
MTRWLKVEFHCHTQFSPDSLTTPNDLVQMARKKGLDRVVVTDHNTIRGALAARELDPERIIVGEEVMTTRGELLASFVSKEVPKGLEPMEAIALLRKQNAFISVSHPFDWARHGWLPKDLNAILPYVDALEILNARCFDHKLNLRAGLCATENDIPGTAGSDAHLARELGTAFLELPSFSNSDELRNVIRIGIVQGGRSPIWVRFGSLFAKLRKMSVVKS